MPRVVDGNILPIVERRTGDRESCVRVTLAVNGVKDLLLRAAAVVVGPEYIRVAATGDDTGAFLDPHIAHVGKKLHAGRDFLTGLRLGDTAHGQ